jgi:hypothetical protein
MVIEVVAKVGSRTPVLGTLDRVLDVWLRTMGTLTQVLDVGLGRRGKLQCVVDALSAWEAIRLMHGVPGNSLLWYVPSSRYIWSSSPIFCFCKNK